MIGRRSFLLRAAPALLIAKPALASAVCTLEAPTETPLDRIHHHMKGLEEAFLDYYGPGTPIHPSFTETSPANLQRDPTMAAYAIVRAGPTLYPRATAILAYNDGEPLLAADRAAHRS
ncbi:hypothetical protein [Xanthobacter sp. 126]|uniref:hypothetical protein n=1 Tax=Xanthobacter sp. 126 TaxID=1131814 RepID=UPI00045EB473|nr:hypothetical protein [Xanthobacter sp. 126]